MHRTARILLACGLALASTQSLAADQSVLAARADGSTRLLVDGRAIHQTPARVRGLRSATIPGSAGFMARWEETTADGVRAMSAVSPDGRAPARVGPAGDVIRLRYAQFDPAAGAPAVAPSLAADADHGVYVVQLIAQPTAASDAALEAAGARIVRALEDNARIVRADAATARTLAAMGIVRWVGPFHPAYKLEEEILQDLLLPGAGDGAGPSRRYSIELFDDGEPAMATVADAILEAGGAVELRVPQTGRLEATLTRAQLMAVAGRGGVHFIDRWQPPQTDMSIVRAVGGASFLDSVAGFSGEGVRGEVLDAGILTSHQEFASPRPILHTSSGVDSHGTATYSIVFADGVSGAAKGMLPDGTGIFGSYLAMGNRYLHTRELVQEAGPYRAVFQSNSWGSGLTTQYSTQSTEMDRIIFDHDILIAQSQSNTGTQQSRPQAWAKNIVSVGGVVHRNTVTLADDCWCGGASRGPAADGRVKPDLTHFFDAVRAATSSGTGSYTEFSGTSAATPIVAGHFGLVFQMWAEGVFGNPTSGGDVFDERPHFTTAKALVINTADPYTFSGPSTSQDKARVKQGWGLPDLREMYDNRDAFFVVDEADPLTEFQTALYPLRVPADTPQLRVTLTWADPPGTTSSSLHRVNNLDLKITAPDGSTYWGNNGLNAGVWSVQGGSPDTVDTVENVFIQNPQAGTWTVEVLAADINRDGHRDTATLDQAFALIAQGVDGLAAAFDLPFADQFESDDLDTERWIEASGRVVVTTLAENEPSEPYSVLLADEATLASNRVNVPGTLLPDNPVSVRFFSQAYEVDAGERMVVEYFSTFFDEWRTLTEIVSDGVSQTTFTEHDITLPVDGYGESFRLRFRVPEADLFDLWYVDDVLVDVAADECRPDLDGDGELTIFDFLAFQNAFDAMDPIADFDGDGDFTIFDFLAFQNEFDAGCP